ARIGQHRADESRVLAQTALEQRARRPEVPRGALQLGQLEPREIAAGAKRGGIAARRVAHLDALLEQLAGALPLPERDRAERLLEDEVGEPVEALQPRLGV